MPWVKLTDDFYEDDKIITAGPVCLAMWIVGLAWSSRNLTDGRIPRAKVRGLLDWDGVAWHMWMNEIVGGGDDVEALDVASELVTAGLWEQDGNGDYRIVNFLKYQPSSESVKEKRKSERERWFARRGSKETPDGVVVESGGSCAVPVPGSRTPPSSFIPSQPSVGELAAEGTNLPDGLWQAVAQRRLRQRLDDAAAGKAAEVTSPAKWVAKAARNAPGEYGTRAADLWARYDLTLGQLVDVLLSESTPQWLNNCERIDA